MPEEKTDWKEQALERVEYLESMLKKSHTQLTNRSYKHGEMCLLLNRPSYMCMATFDNLDRICREVKTAIERIETSGDNDDTTV